MSLRSHVVVPVFLVAVVLMLVVPVTPIVLDLLLAANLTFAVLVLLATLLLRDSLEFSIFPSLLLVATLSRLALNVSSTRLILTNGYAGKLIETFGGFVIGQSVIVGLVVFLILVIIQFVVITNGAGRVAEVAARFTLDAMPGKQMAIDADLTAGLIDEEEARRLRKRIAQEADFYGAMDGASKFVKGDAIAGVIIVAINLIGGFAIGIGSQGLSFGEAIDTYSRLTVGDGLMSQIPALLVAMSTGLLVTRVGSDNDMASDLHRQLLGNPSALLIAGGVVAALGLLPGMPRIPFLVLGAVMALMGQRARQRLGEEQEPAEDPRPELSVKPDDPEAIVARMRVEPLELRLAFDLLDLVDPDRGGDLLERVRTLRRQMADELGLVMPFVRTRDDMSLAAGSYRILVRGSEAARGSAPPGRVLALPADDGAELKGLGGEPTTEPVFGLPALWIPSDQRSAAAGTGATVIDRTSVIVTHLAETVRRNAAQLLSRQDTQLLVDGLREEEPILANEVGSEHLPLATLHAVLRRLLDERVPIRDLGRIVEAITAQPQPRSVDSLADAARIQLGATIVGRLAPDGQLGVVTLDPGMEASLHESIRSIEGEPHLVLPPDRLDALADDLRGAAETGATRQLPVALICTQSLRRPLAQTARRLGIEIPVLAYPELPQHVTVIPIGAIEHAQPSPA